MISALGLSTSDGEGRTRPLFSCVHVSGSQFYCPFWTLEEAFFPEPAPPTGPFRILADESVDGFVAGPLWDDWPPAAFEVPGFGDGLDADVEPTSLDGPRPR